jgi:hypothetical protein
MKKKESEKITGEEREGDKCMNLCIINEERLY